MVEERDFIQFKFSIPPILPVQITLETLCGTFKGKGIYKKKGERN